MASLSNHAENLVAKWLLTADAATRPTEWHLALFTAAPSDTGGGTEVSGGSYAREAVTFTVTDDTASNSGVIEFGPASADWGTVTHVGVFDASSAGNLIAWDVLRDTGGSQASKTVENTDTLEFAAGEIDLVFA